MTTRKTILLFGATLLVSLTLLIYPMYVIRPFRPQGVQELNVALWMVRWRAYFEVLAALAALATLAACWPRKGTRLGASIAALLVCAAAALSQVNVFELMFHRYDQPTLIPAATSKVDPTDKVLAITVNAQSRAYPIRSIGYHHIINDELAGVPLVATY